MRYLALLFFVFCGCEASTVGQFTPMDLTIQNRADTVLVLRTIDTNPDGGFDTVLVAPALSSITHHLRGQASAIALDSDGFQVDYVGLRDTIARNGLTFNWEGSNAFSITRQ
jgi:hypothetical protein